MSNTVMSRSLVAILAATVLTSTVAIAAPLGVAPTAGAPGVQTQATPVQMRPGQFAHHRQMGGVDRVEGRIAFLKAELKLTDAQNSLWEPVAKAMRDQSAALKTLRDQRPQRDQADRERDRTLTAPEALARRDDMIAMQTKMLAARADGQKQFTAAFTKLYAQLSDEHKKTADSLLTWHGRGHRR